MSGAPRAGGTGPPALRSAVAAGARLLSRHRRMFTAAAVFVAVAAALAAIAPGPGATTDAVVTTHDVALGARLSPGDVTVEALPASAVPQGALRTTDEAVGRLVTGPVRQGEVVTDVRLVAPHLSTALADLGLVAAPVRLADPGVARVVRPGDRVDVLAAVPPDGSVASGVAGGVDSAVDGGVAAGATSPGVGARSGGRAAQVVAADAVVVAVPQSEVSDSTDGGLVILAVTPSSAAGLAQSAVVARLTVSLRGG